MGLEFRRVLFRSQRTETEASAAATESIATQTTPATTGAAQLQNVARLLAPIVIGESRNLAAPEETHHAPTDRSQATSQVVEDTGHSGRPTTDEKPAERNVSRLLPPLVIHDHVSTPAQVHVATEAAQEATIDDAARADIAVAAAHVTHTQADAQARETVDAHLSEAIATGKAEAPATVAFDHSRETPSAAPAPLVSPEETTRGTRELNADSSARTDAAHQPQAASQADAGAAPSMTGGPAAPRDAEEATPDAEDDELDFFEAMARMTAPPRAGQEPAETDGVEAGEDESEVDAETREILEALIAETGETPTLDERDSAAKAANTIQTKDDAAEAAGKAVAAKALDAGGSAQSPVADSASNEPDEEPDALDREAPPDAAKPGLGANVVPLRANYRVVSPPPAANDQARAGKAPEERAPRDAAPTIGLSPKERDAFREIARALGARAEAEADIARTTPAKETPKAPEAETPGLRLRDLIAASSDDEPTAEAADETQATMATPPQHGVPAATAVNAEQEAVARNARAIVDRLPSGVLVSRMEVPLYVNKALLDMLDFENADAFHKAGGLERMFRGREPQALAEAAGGGAIPIVTRTGDVVSAIARIQSIDWDGEPASLMTFRATHEADLAPRVRALEAELRHRDTDLRELHAILDTATDGVVVLDAEGRVLVLNKSGEALFGYDQNEVAGEKFTTLLARESHAAAEDYLEGLKANGVASLVNQGREVVGRARQGGAIPVFMTLGRVSAADRRNSARFCATSRPGRRPRRSSRTHAATPNAPAR